MSSASPGNGEPEQEQSFLSHLVELRQRLVWTAVSVLAVMVPAMFYMKEIYDLLARPIVATLPPGSKLLATSVVSPFMVPLKATLAVSFVVALPFVLYQAWAFVAPGLYKHEKRLAVPVIVSSFAMFLSGIAFCYFVVFRFLFPLIQGFAPESVAFAPDIDAYFSFVLGMFFAFGLAFETPVVVVVLNRLGMVSVKQLKSAWPYFAVGAFIVAAIVTPPDVASQLALALPLCLLYLLGLGVCIVLQHFAPTESEQAGKTEAA